MIRPQELVEQFRLPERVRLTHNGRRWDIVWPETPVYGSLAAVAWVARAVANGEWPLEALDAAWRWEDSHGAPDRASRLTEEDAHRMWEAAYCAAIASGANSDEAIDIAAVALEEQEKAPWRR